MSQNATQPHDPEIELFSLHRQRLKAQKGSEEYRRIGEDMDLIKDSMRAHAELFSRLCDSIDRRRLLEFLESRSIIEARFHQAADELLKTDLTLSEMLRLGSLLNEQLRPNVERAQKSTAKRKSHNLI